jgi:TolB protein
MNSRCSSPQCLYPSRVHATSLAVFAIAACAILMSCSEQGSTTLLAPGVLHSSEDNFSVVSTVAFVTTRDDPTNPIPGLAAEIYLMNPDGTNPRRLTTNSDGDGFPSLSPDGKKIVFESNRLRLPEEPRNTSDLFVMDTEGTEQTFLLRGSSASWSPDGKDIVFHASASGAGLPIRSDPGAATSDSDIFTANVDDVIAGRINITNNADAIDDDPDWSPVGSQIVFTSHPITDDPNNSVNAEIYVIDANGGGVPVRLTQNLEEERAPSWSPDGSRIVFMCRHGGPDWELCVMNADGTGQVQLTDDAVNDFTPTWSPDGGQIMFHRPVGGRPQLWIMNADGTGQTQVTNTAGLNLFANWGELRVHVN